MTWTAALAALAGALAAVGAIDLLRSVAGASASRGAAPPRGARATAGAAATAGGAVITGGLTAAGAAAVGGSSGQPVRSPLRRAALLALAGIGRRLPARAPSGLGWRIDAAGVDATPADVMALKGGAALAAVAVALVLAPGFPGRLAWLAVPAAPLLAFLAPDLWLRRRMVRRRRAMERELADVLELLRVAIEAGLTVPRALTEVARRHPGVLCVELRRAASLIALGTGQKRALELLVRRCPAPGVAALVATLLRAERHGAPLGDALAAQAQEARARRARQGIEAAARAAPKIQLIVALLLVPSAMLLMAAAMLPALAWR